MNFRVLSLYGLFCFVGSIKAASLIPRIANGHSTSIENHPYQVSIRVNNIHFCGGAIISDRHILTAGHCTSDHLKTPPYHGVTVHTGTSDSKANGDVHRVAYVSVHPQYVEPDLHNDIAVLTLTEPITFNGKQQKVSLPNFNIHGGEKATIAGWGYTVHQGETPRGLRKVDMKILTSAECQPLSVYDINPKQFCTTAYRGSAGVCEGDSGGPLVINGVVIGVASFIDPPCGKGAPDIYTNVYAYKSFIESSMHSSIDSGRFPEIPFNPDSSPQLPPGFDTDTNIPDYPYFGTTSFPDFGSHYFPDFNPNEGFTSYPHLESQSYPEFNLDSHHLANHESYPNFNTDLEFN